MFIHSYFFLVAIIHRFTVDTKCGASAICWYCQDLCERCLKPATYTFNTVYEGSAYNFCSSDCKDSCFFNQEEISIKLLDISSDDTIQMGGYILKHESLLALVDCKICADNNNNNKLLIVYFERSLQSQLNFQVLCNKAFEILNPVIHDNQLATTDELKEKQINFLFGMVEILKTSNILKIIYKKLLEENNDAVKNLISDA